MKSIFAKYMTVFATVLLASFLMLSSIIATTIKSYYDRQTKEDVARISGLVSDMASREWAEIGGLTEEQKKDFLDRFNTFFSMISKAYEQKVNLVLTDSTGTVLVHFWHAQEGEEHAAKADPEAVAQVLEQHAYEGVTTLGGVFAEAGHVYGKAVCREGDGEVVGMVFACADSTSSSALVKLMNRSVFMSCLWVLLAALVAVYFVTDRLVRPIKGMNEAAARFAKGDFSEHVQVVGKDEIGELAVTFNSMADSLAQLEKMRNSFLANVSHDLRTPMTAIAGFIDGINSGAIPPEKHAYYLNIISSEIHRLSRLVTQILDISRLDSGERKFSFVRCDICETARIVLISFEQKIEAKHLQVEFSAEEESLFVTADKDALHQVIYNLCENAIKFSKEGGALRITLDRVGKKNIRFRVYNEGIGIAEKDLPYVFNRFYKSDKSRGLDKNGVGLGLYIVKSIVDAHDGKISVESREGQDCTFTVVLKETD